MELLYIWIGKYGAIAEVGLNFSNQYRFSLDIPKKQEVEGEVEEEEEDVRVLTVKEADCYTDNFFSKNINNLTGIVGANGAGKTSILRYIIEHCTHGINGNEPQRAVIVFKSEGRYYYYASMPLQLEGLPIIKSFKKEKDLDLFKSTTTAVYLSNQFDPTSFYAHDYTRMQLGENHNISTWYLLQSDYQTRTGKSAAKNNHTFNQRMEAFASMEFMRMVKILRWINQRPERNPFPVQMPPYLNLKLNFSQGFSKKEWFLELTDKFNSYFKVKSSPKKAFLLRAFQAAIYHFIGESDFVVGSTAIIDSYEKVYRALLEYLSKSNYPSNSKNSLIGEINSIILFISIDVFKERLERIIAFLTKLDRVVSHTSTRVDSSGSILCLSIKELNLGALTDLIDEYYNVEKIGDYADFYFSHQYYSDSSLSSGEYTFLSVFGRLNNLKIKGKKSILLLIDEAELALHPQWQKMFIALFIDFIAEKLKRHKVQIVLTSHSPFILSDLPPNCVILLKRDNDRTVVVDSLDKRNETFGANIHELFTDSFFLQDGLIGDFANKKIDDLINRVNKEKGFTREKYNFYKKEIDIIGEPFVRFKLLEKMMRGLSESQLDSVITEREKELELIKKIRKNDKNSN